MYNLCKHIQNIIESIQYALLVKSLLYIHTFHQYSFKHSIYTIYLPFFIPKSTIIYKSLKSNLIWCLIFLKLVMN